MKKFLLSLLFTLRAFAPTLEWDANSESNLAGYKAYYGASSRVYTTTVDVGNFTTVTLPTLPGVTYYAVTAYDEDGLESEFSDEVFWTTNPHFIWTLPAGRLLIESTFGLLAPISWMPIEELTGSVNYVIEIDTTISEKYFRYTIQP